MAHTPKQNESGLPAKRKHPYYVHYAHYKTHTTPTGSRGGEERTCDTPGVATSGSRATRCLRAGTTTPHAHPHRQAQYTPYKQPNTTYHGE